MVCREERGTSALVLAVHPYEKSRRSGKSSIPLSMEAGASKRGRRVESWGWGRKGAGRLLALGPEAEVRL